MFHYQAEIIKITLFTIAFFVFLFKKKAINVKKYFFLSVPFFISYIISFNYNYFDSHFLFSHFITSFIFIFIFDTEKAVFYSKLKYLAYASVVVAIFGLINYYGYNNFFMPIGDAFSRGFFKSTIGNTNSTADFLATSLPLMLFCFFKEKDFRKSFLFWISGTLSALEILLCQTRSILFGLFLSLIIYFVVFIFLKRINTIKVNFKKVILIFFAFMISFALFVSPPGYPENLDSPLVQLFGRASAVISDEESVNPAYKRELEWKTAYNMFLEKPLFGHGWGSYKLLSPDFQMRITNEEPKFFGYYQRDFKAHCDWLQLLAEGGLFVFFSFFALIMIIFIEAVKKILSGDILSLAVFCSWMIIIVHSFVEFPLYMEPSLSMFALLSAYLLKDLPKKVIPQNVKNIFLLAYVFVLYITVRFFVSDLTVSISNYYSEMINAQLVKYESEVGFEDYKSNQMFLDIMNQVFYADIALSMNQSSSYAYLMLTSGLNRANTLDSFDQSVLLNSFAPYDLYEGINNGILEYRQPPKDLPEIPSETNFYGLDLNNLIMRITMNELNIHIDSFAILRMARIQKTITAAFIKSGVSYEKISAWIEWMKYSYRFSLDMKGRDSSDWYCIDIEFLNALADIEGITKEFEDEFIFRLQHREKLIEYGIDDDLPALWYDFYDQNISRLSSEQRELAKGLMLKIQRMVNENQK